MIPLASPWPSRGDTRESYNGSANHGTHKQRKSLGVPSLLYPRCSMVELINLYHGTFLICLDALNVFIECQKKGKNDLSNLHSVLHNAADRMDILNCIAGVTEDDVSIHDMQTIAISCIATLLGLPLKTEQTPELMEEGYSILEEVLKERKVPSHE
jgi:hypothetical protein